MDHLSQAQRSEMMARVRDRDTTPELRVRSIVHRLGYRFRLHRRDLPGTPDLVFPRLRRIVFVHGCFWHMHTCPRGRSTPTSNAAFWRVKRTGNVARDRLARAQLRRAGWRVLTLWECQLKDESMVVRRLVAFLGKAKSA